MHHRTVNYEQWIHKHTYFNWEKERSLFFNFSFGKLKCASSTRSKTRTGSKLNNRKKTENIINVSIIHKEEVWSAQANYTLEQWCKDKESSVIGAHFCIIYNNFVVVVFLSPCFFILNFFHRFLYRLLSKWQIFIIISSASSLMHCH